MTRLFCAWLTLAAMCMLFLFKINLNSDLLFLDSVAVDLFQHGGAWGDWKFTPAPAYMPDMLAYFLGYFIFPAATQRIVFVCFVQAMLLAWVCMHLARLVKPSFSRNAQVCVLLITATVVLVAANSAMWLFFSSTNNHFAALVFPLLCLSWIFEFLKAQKPLALVWLAAGVAAGAASTSVFTLSFSLPALLLLAGCVVVLRSHRPFRRMALQIGAAILAGETLAALLQKILLSYDALQGRAPLTVEAALRSIGAFVTATGVTFGTENLYTFTLAIFLVIIIVWLLLDWVLGIKLSVDTAPPGFLAAWLKISDKNWVFSLSLVFLLVALPVNVVGAVLSGGFVDPWGYRYFAFPIALGVLLWVVMLDSKPAFASRPAGLVLVLGLVSVATLGILSIKPLLLQTQRASYAEVFEKGGVGPGDAIGSCLDQEAKNGFIFGAGIGDFWNTRGVSYKTGSPLYVLPVLNDATPFFHMMSVGPLVDPTRYGIQSYNFVLMRKSGTATQFNFTPETVGRLLPRPARIVNCDNSDTELWLYTDLRLDAVVKKMGYSFLGQQGLLRQYHMAAHELPGGVGKVESLTRVAQDGRDAAGYLSYGPYIKLPPGRYQVIISYSSTAAGNKWDAGRFNNPKKLVTLAAGEVPAGNGDLKFSFEITKSVDDFEIRTWFGGHGTFSLRQIQLQLDTSSGHMQPH
jgi:hypothetical protein